MNTAPITGNGRSASASKEYLGPRESSIQGLVFALVCLLGLLAYIVYVQYREAEADAKSATRNLVEVIESHVSNDFSRVDGVLTYIATRVSASDLQGPPTSLVQATQEKRLADLRSSFPIIDGLFIFDAEGILRYGSPQNSKRISIADRPHFQQLRDNPEAQVSFSDAEITRTTGKWSIAQLRALRDEKGRFLGTVNALIALEHVGKAFGNIDVGPGGVMLLRRSDTSRLTLRIPRNNEKDFNQPLPPNNPIRQRIEAGEQAATLTLVASTDGVERIASFKRLVSAPFYVQVALAKGHYLADWQRDSIDIAGFALLLVLGFGFVIWKLKRDAATIEAANSARRETAQRHALLVAASPSGIWQTDAQGTCTFVSPQWSELAGITADSAIGHGWASGLHPEDRERIHSEWVETARTDARTYHSDFRFSHPDGRIIWVHSQAVAETDASDQVIGWIGTITDITAQKEIESALRESDAFVKGVLDSVQSNIAVIDPDGFILAVNQNWRLFSTENSLQVGQMTPKTDIGTNYIAVCLASSVTEPKADLSAGEGVRAVLAGRLPAFECEYRCDAPDEERWFTMTVSPLGSPKLGAVVVHTNITERKRAELALEHQTAALAHSNAELDQFAYVASHDLRQPLRMVNSYVQMLERRLADKLDDETRDMMHFATDGAKRMDQMLVSLLEYSRVGRKGEPLAPLASRSGVDEAMQFLAPAITEAHATVRVSGDWPEILASRDEFTRLWQNLIGNAVKYSAPDRAPEIDIAVVPDGDGWRFSVADNGIGIEPAQFDRLFKVFQRLHTREQYEGTGIGLAVARKIVERHGGRIWVESGGMGQGCRFYFGLPALAVEASS